MIIEKLQGRFATEILASHQDKGDLTVVARKDKLAEILDFLRIGFYRVAAKIPDRQPRSGGDHDDDRATDQGEPVLLEPHARPPPVPEAPAGQFGLDVVDRDRQAALP